MIGVGEGEQNATTESRPYNRDAFDVDSSTFRRLEYRVLSDCALISRWRAKQVARPPSWTRSSGGTSAAIENTGEGRDPITGARCAKIGLSAPMLSAESRDAAGERLDSIGRELENRLATFQGEIRTVLERAVQGFGSTRTHAIYELVGVSLATEKQRKSWQAAKCLWMNGGARGRDIWIAAVTAWCGVREDRGG